MTTREEVDGWKALGIAKGATHLIVACDTFEYDDFPVYVMPGESLADTRRKYSDGSAMLRIMEEIALPAAKTAAAEAVVASAPVGPPLDDRDEPDAAGFAASLIVQALRGEGPLAKALVPKADRTEPPVDFAAIVGDARDDFAHFLARVDAAWTAYAMRRPRYMRRGQFFANALYAARPEIFAALQGSGVDCWSVDANLPAWYVHVALRWTGP